MSHKRKIIIWSVLCTVVVLLVVAVLCANGIVSSIADRKLRQQLADNDRLTLTYDRLQVRLMEGYVSADNIYCSLAPVDTLLSDSLGQTFAADKLEVRGINWFKLRKKQLLIGHINVESPQVKLQFADKSKKNNNIKPSTEETDTTALDGKQEVFFELVRVHKISLSDGSVGIKKLTDKFSFSTDSVNIQVRDLCYDFVDSAFTYNDSVYELSLRNLNLTTADGLVNLKLAQLSNKDAGPLTLRSLRARNTCPKEQLANRQGKIPVTWFDAQIDKLLTSDVNLVRQIVRKDVNVEKVSVYGHSVQIYRDMQYPPKVPYPMPQEEIMNIPLPVHVGALDVHLPRFNISVTNDGSHVGNMHIDNISVSAQNFSNSKNNTMAVAIKSRLTGGDLNARLTLRNDKNCSFAFNFSARDLRPSQLEDFLVPIAGTSAHCRIHSLDISSQGGSVMSKSNFCMVYDSMAVNIHQDAPIEKLAKSAGLINFFAPAVVYKSNPRPNTVEPFACETQNTRDPWQNFAMYLMSPLMDGMLHTVLPEGIYRMIEKGMKKKASNSL